MEKTKMEISAARAFVLTFILTLILGNAASASEASFDKSHSLLQQVLTEFVKDGLVNYKSLKEKPENLNSYLNQLASVSETQFNQWVKNEQLAFLINLYNAATLKLIIDHYPVKSIKDIGSIVKGPWDQPVVRLFGKLSTLGYVEHELLRKHYEEPRIHFALVCAARGCPALRSEVYAAEKLEKQLEDQGFQLLNHFQKNHIQFEERTIYLSPIFKWFKEDFERKSGSVLNFIRPYFPPEVSQKFEVNKFKIKYTEYDWSLNDIKDSTHE